MSKDEFAERLAKKCGVSKAKAVEVIDAIFSNRKKEGLIAIELDAGRAFPVVGFGTWKTRKSKAPEGPEPADREGNSDQGAEGGDVQGGGGVEGAGAGVGDLTG